MSTTAAEPPLVPLRLSSREQWLFHYVLSHRIERSRRSPEATPPPPSEIPEALGKLESGSLLFTAAELRRAREALAAHLRSGAVSPAERREVGHLADRIDGALRNRTPGVH